jgi:oligopeptide transport system substrate-binding protein
MFSRKLAILAVLVMIAPIVLAACGPTPEPVVIKETSVVVETVVVEKEGETVVQEVTSVVEVEKVVTATPAPEPTEAPPVTLEGLWYPVGTEPPTLDTQLATDTTSHLIIHQLVDGLFEYRGDGSIVPSGALDYTVSDDGLTYTINLRPGVVWSDGEPVVAQHYVDGVVRLLLPETAAEYAWLMYDVEGAEAFNTGETDDPATVGVKAVDDLTLEVTLVGPRTYFETVLPFSTFYPVRMDVVEQYGDQWTEPGNYVGNGAYLLESWEHEAEVVLVKNPTYWDADSVTIEKITIPVITEQATCLALYENDEIHVTGCGYPSEDMPRILEDPVLSQELRTLPRPGVYYVGLHTLRAPTDDVNVRKALASAIDRRTLMDNVLNTPWRDILTCTTPPNIIGYQEPGTCGYDFDVEAAKQYLADAGYPDGEGFPVLSVWFNRGNEDILEGVQAMWTENLGINVELRTNEWAVYLDYLDQCNTTKEELAACEFNAYRMGWVMDYGDPQNQLQVVFAPSSTFQYTGWESARFDELMDLASAEFDTAKREEYYKEADKILCEDEVAIIPIYAYDRTTLVKEGITFEFPPFGAQNFKYWSIP